MKTIFILYVKDQSTSKKFYSMVLEKDPVLDVPGMIEFTINEFSALGLMPEDGIRKILGGSIPHPKEGSGVPRSEIYLYVENPSVYSERLIAAGGRIISSLALRDWGDETAYGIDLDGHILAFAKKV